MAPYLSEIGACPSSSGVLHSNHLPVCQYVSTEFFYRHEEDFEMGFFDARFGTYLAVAALLIMTPGPDTALVTRHALLSGRRAAFFTTLGIGHRCSVRGISRRFHHLEVRWGGIPGVYRPAHSDCLIQRQQAIRHDDIRSTGNTIR